MNPSNQNNRDQANQTIAPAHVARDVVAVLLLAILLICIHNLVDPFTRGIHCNDGTIRYPYKDSTVSTNLLYLCGAGLNIGLIFLMEYQLLLEKKSHNNNEAIDLSTYGWNVYCRLLIWFFGAISSEFLTDLSKVSVGRLRPHFLDVCRPMVGTASLDEFCNLPGNQNKYVLDYKCTGDSSKFRESRLSFMSGHSSCAAYSATFAVLYLQTALSSSRFGLFKPSLQVLLISLAFYVGLSRISDYKHHWEDVLTGLAQGTTVATIVTIYLWPSVRKLVSLNLRNSGDPVEQELNRVSY